MTQRSVLAAALVLALAPSAAGAERGSPLRLFAAVNWIAPLDDSPGRLDGDVASLEASSSSGWEAGLEWRFNPRFGLEASIARAELDIDFGADRLGTVDFDPIYLAFNVHVWEGEAVDWWVAPTLMLLDWGEGDFERGVELGETSDEFLGMTVGVDVHWADEWAFSAALRYFDAQIRFGGGGEAAVDPLVLRAGVSWRP